MADTTAEREENMTFTTFKTNREMNINELREVLTLMENQETNDADVNTTLHINGNDADIVVEIDEDGNVTLL